MLNIAVRHNHQHCIDEALSLARELCHQRQLKFTRIRELVLATVWKNHQPIGAYSILAEVAKYSSSRPAPPTIYRALDFLLENGLIHRISSLNAFVGCNDPSHMHQSHFLICRHCQLAIELPADILKPAISHAALGQNFTVEDTSVEVLGSCAKCSEVQRHDQ
jgi:Fur family zinc uptake transcriptional regulator